MLKLFSRRRWLLGLLTLTWGLPPATEAASWDQNAALGTRTVPFGGALTGELGWHTLLWGERKNPEDFHYGFLRAAARFSGSGFVNRGDAFLTIAPLSTLAFDFGGTARLRLVDEFATVECPGFQCRGWISGRFGRIRAVGGVGPVFLLAATTWEHLIPENATLPFVDEQSALEGGDPARVSNGDIRKEETLLLGAKVHPQWNAGLLYQTSRMLRAGTSNRQLAGFARWQWTPNWALLGGAGTYASSTHSESLTLFLRAEWNDLRSPDLM
jgi:hypothetical protein